MKKIDLLIFGVVFALVCSCGTTKNLPFSEDIDINEHGSFIKIYQKPSSISGELISLDSNEMVVLTEKSAQCVIVPLKTVKKFKLIFANSKKYGWSVPLFTIATAPLGWIAVLGATPVNIIVTTAVSESSNSAFTYKNKNISFEEMKMFARFPQGIPTNIKIDSIK